MSTFFKSRIITPTLFLSLFGFSILLFLWWFNFIPTLLFFLFSVFSIPVKIGDTLFAFWGGENKSGNLLSVVGFYCKAYQHIWVVSGLSFYQKANYSVNQFLGISIYCEAGEDIFHLLSISFYNKTRNSIVGLLSVNIVNRYKSKLISLLSLNFSA